MRLLPVLMGTKIAVLSVNRYAPEQGKTAIGRVSNQENYGA